jgi:hypothetical protein
MATIELIRKTNQEIDQLERASATQLLKKTKQHKDQLLQEWRVAENLSQIEEKSKFLQLLYADDQKMLETEIDGLVSSSGQL